MKAIIRRRTGESAQQRDIVPPRPQTRTEGDEGHRVGLGATHSGHQDVVSQQGFDQQTETQEEVVETEAIRDARHPEIHLTDPFNDGESISRGDSLPLARRDTLITVEYGDRRRFLNGEGQSSCDPALFFFSLFLSFVLFFFSITNGYPVTFERASLSSRTSFVHRRSEKRPEGSVANSYSPRSVSGWVNGMMPAGVWVPYALVRGGEPMNRRRCDPCRYSPRDRASPLCERVASDPLHPPSRISPCFGNRLARTDIDWNR